MTRTAEPWDRGPRRRPGLDRHWLEVLLDEADDLVDILRHGPRDPDTKKRAGISAPQLVDLARTARNVSARDGFGNHTPGMDAPEGKPRRVIDKDGAIIPVDPDAGPPISDPTGEAAIAGLQLVEREHPDRINARELGDRLERAVDELRNSVNALIRSQGHDEPAGTGEPCCKSHARLGIFEPIYDKAKASELCRWCYDWWLNTGTWPTKPLLEKRAQGVRITTKVLRECGVAS